MKEINIVDLNKKLKEIEVIDVREGYEVATGKVPGAKHVPLRELAYNHDKYLEKGGEYYIICQSGNRSSQLIAFLQNEDYKLVNVIGGTGTYSLQFPLE